MALAVPLITPHYQRRRRDTQNGKKKSPVGKVDFAQQTEYNIRVRTHKRVHQTIFYDLKNI